MRLSLRCLSPLLLLVPVCLTAAPPRMTVTPDQAKAGSTGVFEFVFVAGEGGLQPGGGFEWVVYCKNDTSGRAFLWSCPREGTTGLGAYTVSSVHADLNTQVVGPRTVQVNVLNGTVPEGGEVRITYQGQAQAIAREVGFYARSRANAQSDWVVVAEADRAKVNITPRQAIFLIAFAPADVTVGEAFDLHLTALDKFGNPAEGYRGRVMLQSTENPTGNPAFYTFTAEDAGLAEVRGLRFQSPGLHRILISDDDSGTVEEDGNWMEVHEQAPALRRFVGETHFHTGGGNAYDGWAGAGGDHKGNYARIDEAYRYLRDVWRMDFASAAEHDSGLDPEAHALVEGVTNSYYDAGAFTTFHAYEWTQRHTKPQGGHRVVVYSGDRMGAAFSSTDSRYETQSDLFSAVNGQGIPAIVIPHMMRHYDQHQMWVKRNNKLQTLAEIYSAQNESNAMKGDKTAFELDWTDPWSVRYAWKKGNVFGVIGSSDNHLGTPGHHKYSVLTQHQEGGYAYVFAQGNNRADLFEAMQDRRTYATTGIRALARLEVDGKMMGSLLRKQSGAPAIQGYVAAHGPIRDLKLFRADRKRGFSDMNPQDLDPRPEVFAFQMTDTTWDQHTLYYVRAEQTDGELIWTSPVWVLKKKTLGQSAEEVSLEEVEREFDIEGGIEETRYATP